MCMDASSSANGLDGNVLPSQLTALHPEVLDRIAETLFHTHVGPRIAAFETEQARRDVSFTRKNNTFLEQVEAFQSRHAEVVSSLKAREAILEAREAEMARREEASTRQLSKRCVDTH